MKKHVSICIFFLCILALTACGREEKTAQKGFDIVGVWQLIRTDHPDGTVIHYDNGRYTRCKIYCADSTYYSVEMFSDGKDIVIRPHEMARYTLNDSVYIENGRLTPFEIKDDSTMTTVWQDYIETVRKVNSMSETRKQEICDIVRVALSDSNDSTRISRYITSTSERELRTANHHMLYIIIILLLTSAIALLYFLNTLKGKRKLERQLHELEEIRNLRSQPVPNALKEAEAEFFQSALYHDLRKIIISGSNLSQKEWKALEQKLKEVYPDFSTALCQMYNLSETEYQVCLLIKNHATPTEIAGVMKRESSTISSMRGRMFRKVFNKKGSAKDWDEFILSL